jgi:hypothetical protein
MSANSPCTVCNGTGKQTITAHEYRADGTFVKEPPVAIDCIWCDGSGKMTPEQGQTLQDYKDSWCRCAHSSGSHYWEFDHSHGWACNDCGKVTQYG